MLLFPQAWEPKRRRRAAPAKLERRAGDRTRRRSPAPAHSALIQCAVGRDRTGIVVALLLDLLEVEEEVIAADYAFSDGVVEDGERAQAQTIHCLLALLRKQHISTHDMLIRAGVSALCIDEFQRLLLVRSSRT